MNICKFSDCRTYRYMLKHVWDDKLNCAIFIGLNPSTADENNLDPTLRRIKGFSSSWGYGSFVMLNLFAFRATSPDVMKRSIDPIGPDNDYWIQTICDKYDLIVACWGNNGTFKNRHKHIHKISKRIKCFKITKTGQPYHPLYLSKKTPLIDWRTNGGNYDLNA